MLTLQRNFPLKNYNTFSIDVTARYAAEAHSIDDLRTLLQLTEVAGLPKLILGGGSNILFTKDFDGLVILMRITGITIVNQNDSHIWIEAGAGVNWHQFVMFCVENNYAGLENLSLIPGTVGAAPMQNIGAYGVEIEQVFDSLTALHIDTGEVRVFTHADCRFGYRESTFKHSLKGQYIITSVTFRLSKEPELHISYGAIQETLSAMGISPESASIRDVSNAVINIRRSKLPDPAVIGNAGSFFKNPEVPVRQFNALKQIYPSIPGYFIDAEIIKVPAGWLIEQAGWKGYRSGDIGVHAKQALVLVNYGYGTGSSLIDLANQIQTSVFEKFGIHISPEVNFL